MRSSRVLWIVPVVLALSAAGLLRLSGAFADTSVSVAADTDHSLSPYFVVEGAEPGVDALPLESTNARVHIAGVIADVLVTQTYQNQGKKPISARYVFPASTRAAVYGMKMTVGNRVIVAKIKEKKEARREYEQAKREGKTASLLEEDRPNVFTMQVANIMPGDHIQVELHYNELLVPTDGAYELDYPTVVGPRYASANVDPGAADNQFVASPYHHSGEAPDYALGLDVDIAAGMPIQSIESPSHRIETHYGAHRDSATIRLAGDARTAGNRDFVLRYELGGDDISSGLLLSRGDGENFFLMMVQPPARPTADEIPPREYVFIVDVSGSMSGFPLDTAKALMRDLLHRLRPTDRFNVLLFAGDSRLYAESSKKVSDTEIASAIAFMDGRNGGGGTELRAALDRALALPRASQGVSRTFVVITDGYIAEEPGAFEDVRNNLGDANVFAFGIGSSVNRYLIEGLARAGQGESFVVESEGAAGKAAARFRDYIESPVLSHVRVSFHGFDAYDVVPASLPDLFAQRPVVVFGKWRGDAKGKIALTGVSGHGRFVNTFEVDKFSPDPHNAVLAQLWARTRISDLSDYYQGDTNRDQVVELGLRYNLLTRFTSFIAIHQVVRADGRSVDVDQPLPMPDGVSDEAIGYVGGPEPSLWILLGLALAGLVAVRVLRRRRAEAA